MRAPRPSSPACRLGPALAATLLLAACAGERSGAANAANAHPAETSAASSDVGAIDPANWPQPQWPFADDPALEKKVDDLLATMTVEEKVGQIVQGDIAS